MIALPEAFLSRMREKLGEKFPDFLRSYELPVRRAVRVNTLKLSAEEFEREAPFPLGDRVPWESSGFYTEQEKTGAYPAHFAGLYYSQEPSAMCAAPLLDVAPGERVLDVCAAPGGKTTQLAQALCGEGVLIANEYVPDRAKALSQNVERLGIKNCAVINADVGRIAAAFPRWFDKVLVDAPCSGEGMFKKEPAALTEWSEENAARCAARQDVILDNASATVRGGGKLVYSTCTFSDEENEGAAERFLRSHPDFRLISMHRLYPHEVAGEGHFAALFERCESERGEKRGFPLRRDRKAEESFAAFCADVYAKEPPTERVTVLPDGRMYAVSEGMPDLTGFRVLRAGVELGEWDGKLFRPAHALAMSGRAEEFSRFLPLGDEDAERYLRGETLQAETENGWCAVGWGKYPLGWGKAVNGTVKNHYPKGLRKVH